MARGTFTECPKCGARVTKEKLRRHLNTVHGNGGKRASAPPNAAAPTVKFPWRAMGALAIVGLVVFASGYWFFGRGNPEGGSTNNGSSGTTTAIITTSKGTITLHLAMQNAPRTAGNFVTLAEGGQYDSNRFHRVARDFVIQAGAVSGAGNVAWEATGLTNTQYSVAMARSGDANDAGSKDTATSQFFINLKSNPSLDGYAYPYVVFAHVIDGFDVVQAIGALAPPSGDGEPTETVTIVSIRIVR